MRETVPPPALRVQSTQKRCHLVKLDKQKVPSFLIIGFAFIHEALLERDGFFQGVSHILQSTRLLRSRRVGVSIAATSRAYPGMAARPSASASAVGG